jgi:hypothetical protein
MRNIEVIIGISPAIISLGTVVLGDPYTSIYNKFVLQSSDPLLEWNNRLALPSIIIGLF